MESLAATCPQQHAPAELSAGSTEHINYNIYISCEDPLEPLRPLPVPSSARPLPDGSSTQQVRSLTPGSLRHSRGAPPAACSAAWRGDTVRAQSPTTTRSLMRPGCACGHNAMNVAVALGRSHEQLRK